MVLLSGGLDSSTSAAIAKDSGFEIYALSFNYKQRHLIELESAKKVAKKLNAIEHHVIDIDLGKTSALTNREISVPKNRDIENAIKDESWPVTYVPARNTIFLSYALSYAERICAADIFIGVTAVDYSGYRDCRPEFIQAFERMANLATDSQINFKIHTPLINYSKRQIIEHGIKLGFDYSLTHSCYDPKFLTKEGAKNIDKEFLAPSEFDSKEFLVYACGTCDSCEFRLLGFKQAKLCDPIPYISNL